MKKQIPTLVLLASLVWLGFARHAYAEQRPSQQPPPPPPPTKPLNGGDQSGDDGSDED